ncbi:MAG TPA: hypothetical protein V6D29_09755, partial [Leptolyngbyaceae cyanobacterium]
MADVCWMTAQLLANCVNEAMSQTPAIALEAVTEVFVQDSLGSSMLSMAPSADSLTPDLPGPLCQLPQMRPRRMVDCLGSDTLEGAYGLEQPEQTSGIASPAVAAQAQGAIAATLSTSPIARPPLAVQPTQSAAQINAESPQFSRAVAAIRSVPASDEVWGGVRPRTGSQLYYQRRAALQAGKLYTHIAPSEFVEQWQMASEQPTYQQWQDLLAQEAQSVAMGQGNNRLTIIVGDSLSLWLPPEWLSRDRFWLNQSISGETSAQILQRLPTFAATRPDTIHVMAGVN